MSVRRGDEAFRYEQYGAAITAYRAYLDESEQDHYTASVLYKTALAEYRLGRYRTTLATLDELSERYPRGRWVQVDALRGDAERAMGNLMVALQAWDAGWKVAGETDRAKLAQRIKAAARQLNDVELTRARRVVTTDGVRDLLDRQIAARQPPPIGEPIPEIEGEPSRAVAQAGAPATILEEPARDVSRRPTRAGSPQETAEIYVPPDLATRTVPGAPTATGTVEPPRGDVSRPRTRAGSPQETAEIYVPPDLATRAEPGPPTTAGIGEPARGFGPTFEEHVVRGVARIGCVLPLSGPAQSVGERALRGLRLAFGTRGDRLVIKDSESDPNVSVAMFEDLWRNQSILGVIGPLRGDNANAVAVRAEQRHLPLLLLSDHDVAHGPFVLQAGMTESQRLATLLDYAMRKMRMRRFGVIYPNRADGKRSLATFRTAVERRGGSVVGAGAYPPGPKNVTANAAAIRRWRDADNLQAIFLPDHADAAARLAKFLQRAMPDVTLLGIDDWHALADRGRGKGLNGVVFSDQFYADSFRPATREFTARFQAAYGSEPGALEAEVYDAAMVAMQALDAGVTSRASMLRQLSALDPFEGAAGDWTMTPDGLQRSTFLLQVYDGHLQEILVAPGAASERAVAWRAPDNPDRRTAAGTTPVSTVP